MFGKPNESHCVICGKLIYPTNSCMFTGEQRCDKQECSDKAREFANEKDNLYKIFDNEKERVLGPIKGKFDADLFLLERKYFHIH